MPDLSLAKAKFFTMNHFFPPSFLLNGNEGDRTGYGRKLFDKT